MQCFHISVPLTNSLHGKKKQIILPHTEQRLYCAFHDKSTRVSQIDLASSHPYEISQTACGSRIHSTRRVLCLSVWRMRWLMQVQSSALTLRQRLAVAVVSVHTCVCVTAYTATTWVASRCYGQTVKSSWTHWCCKGLLNKNIFYKKGTTKTIRKRYDST